MCFGKDSKTISKVLYKPTFSITLIVQTAMAWFTTYLITFQVKMDICYLSHTTLPQKRVRGKVFIWLYMFILSFFETPHTSEVRKAQVCLMSITICNQTNHSWWVWGTSELRKNTKQIQGQESGKAGGFSSSITAEMSTHRRTQSSHSYIYFSWLMYTYIPSCCLCCLTSLIRKKPVALNACT